MGTEILATYLNDHLAGSVAAIELLDHVGELSKGTERERLFATLKSEVEEDQKVLKELLRGLGGTQSRNLNLDQLERRAQAQHDRVELERLEVARTAFGT